MEQIRTAIAMQGFARVEGVFGCEQLREIEEILDFLLLGGNSMFCRLRHELSDDPADGASRQPEFSRPTLVAPRLKRSAVFLTCHKIASAVLGGRAHYLFDHAIYKMPRSGASTPWHQDQAYLGGSVDIRSLHFWIPLQDTDAASGCLRYVPGSHRGALLLHKSAHLSNRHILRADCGGTLVYRDMPVRRGDVSIHTNMTLHSSGANDTDRIRKAWIVHFGDRPGWYKHLVRARALFRRHVAPAAIPARGFDVTE